ncbi:Hypothetical predicted protein [Paramuricea clavata]|nr:Hypothetical predicted protein [Paramuricea clavata]
MLTDKILLTLGVVVTISALGSALTCNVCSYTSKQPKAQQMCGNSTVNCTTGYCYTTKYTTADGTVNIARDCANNNPSDKDCPDGKETCERRTKAHALKYCVASCCQTNNCNNDYIPASSTPTKSAPTSRTPTSSASGIMATKFILCLMVLPAILFA